MIVSPGMNSPVWVDDLMLTRRGIDSSPKLIALITFDHGGKATA